jgi:hypothetical protein
MSGQKVDCRRSNAHHRPISASTGCVCAIAQCLDEPSPQRGGVTVFPTLVVTSVVMLVDSVFFKRTAGSRDRSRASKPSEQDRIYQAQHLHSPPLAPRERVGGDATDPVLFRQSESLEPSDRTSRAEATALAPSTLRELSEGHNMLGSPPPTRRRFVVHGPTTWPQERCSTSSGAIELNAII